MIFESKNVYITGGSSGIGLSVARLLLAEGANVLLISRSHDKLEQAKLKLAGDYKEQGRIGICPLDVSDPIAVLDTMNAQTKEFGPADILINCAGLAIPRKFEDISYEQFDFILRTNLHGPWNMCSALIGDIKRNKGYIVNVSSIAGFIGVFGYTDYCASKFGLIGLSEALRSEFEKEGITVSVLCPPDTDTPAFAEENKTKPAETKALSANASILHPDQVARVLIKGMKKRKFMIIPGMDGKLARRAKSIAPDLVHRMIQRDIKKASK